MEKLLTFMNTWLGKLYIPCGIPADKQQHFISGAILGILFASVFGWAGILWVAAIACAKEVYDYLNPDKHTADIWDWVATMLGGVLGTVCGMGVLG